ncbi:MAG: tRNA pseudouridine(13) synthase TruD [Candidatus Peribacteria bacterium]|jgi:tRNA(Glu) U13 pseudouridine synthase TruD|nr:tRNA pseudouridine(13) synthase TruD [Candidatus Peribacteria bacterium]
MLQAFASGWFNEYVMRRRDKGQHLLNGDIVVDRYQPEGARVGVYENGGVKVVDYERLKKRNEEKGIWEISENFLVDSPSCAATTRKPLWTPTGPMVGWNLLVPSMGSKARVREEQLFEVAGFDEQVLARGKAYHLRGVRRPLWVRVEDLEVWFEGNDCLLHFSLPTGSYATVLLAFVLAGVDALTLKDNRLEIPRVVKNRQL